MNESAYRRAHADPQREDYRTRDWRTLRNTQSPKGKRRRSRGQALVEFALLLPVMVLVFASAVDFARVYEAKIKLESATRDAAEFVASDLNASTKTDPLAAAKRIICLQFGQASTCSEPSVQEPIRTEIFNAGGGTALYPLVKATVTSTFKFRTIMPYPLVTNGGELELTARSEYSVLWGR